MPFRLTFKKNVSEVLPESTTATLLNGSTKDFISALPRCPYFEGGPYQIGIIAFDDACSLPLSDTLKIEVNIEPPPNAKPYFVDPVQPLLIIPPLDEGNSFEREFEVTRMMTVMS
ncbi:MAG: hypothetical protein U5K54_21540 [Cytophagales bacterium]|nr:hypothetical protein [Cytophagales bacterium]